MNRFINISSSKAVLSRELLFCFSPVRARHLDGASFTLKCPIRDASPWYLLELYVDNLCIIVDNCG
jgi:hypothetical protein